MISTNTLLVTVRYGWRNLLKSVVLKYMCWNIPLDGNVSNDSGPSSDDSDNALEEEDEVIHPVLEGNGVYLKFGMYEIEIRNSTSRNDDK